MLQLITPTREEIGNCRIWLTDTEYCIVGADDWVWLRRYTWKLIKSSHCKYAVRRETQQGKSIEIKMHREIMNAPEGMDVHHVNSNTLDNRKANLMLVDKSTHRILHNKSR